MQGELLPSISNSSAPLSASHTLIFLLGITIQSWHDVRILRPSALNSAWTTSPSCGSLSNSLPVAVS